MLSSLSEKLKSKGKAGYVALAILSVIGLTVFFFLNVWLLGTLAAAIQGAGMWSVGNSVFASASQKASAVHAFDNVSWYFHHPFLTARAWLTKPASELSSPLVKQIWLALNGFLLFTVTAAYILRKLKKVFFPDTLIAPDRDIRELRFKQVIFNAEREIQRTPAGQVFLGLDDHRRLVRVAWQEMTEHVHILGGSGSGKTSLAVIPICVQAIRRGLPVIAIDFKGDKQAIQLLARETKKTGKKFYLFSLHPRVKSNTYNPLNFGNTLSKVERVMTALELVFEGEAKFYTYCQQAVFIPLLKHLDGAGIKYTMKDVQQLLKNVGLVEKITGDEMTPGQVKGLTAALTPYADLGRINDPEPDIDLGRVMETGDVVYFDLRSAIAPELTAAMGKMIAMDLQARASYRDQTDKITILAIDEFQNMACRAFRNIISKVRSANYALVLANQALGDLQAIGEDFLNTITTNTRTKIVFNVDDPADAEYFAKRSGQIIIRVESRSRSSSMPAGIAAGGGQSTEGESIHEQDKHLVHSNTLLKLPFGKSVIYRRGELALLSNHSHLISRSEKDQLEREPYPDPAKVSKRGVKTVGQVVSQMKQDIIEGQNNGQSQPAHRPGQVENAGVETEDIAM
ncbi:MAG: AAA-like domain protein [Pelotomaculum sp. PtaB.Bin104]|nr:MAG: AAA-like domain protein [Pelotomaculum sp. PtaB.Bin104]